MKSAKHIAPRDQADRVLERRGVIVIERACQVVERRQPRLVERSRHRPAGVGEADALDSPVGLVFPAIDEAALV